MLVLSPDTIGRNMGLDGFSILVLMLVTPGYKCGVSCV